MPACTGSVETPSLDGGKADLAKVTDQAPTADQVQGKDQAPKKDLVQAMDKAPIKDQLKLDAAAPLIFSHPFTSDPTSASKAIAILKPGKGFSAKGWNSNNSGMILYSASKPITSGYVEVQMAGFTNASLAAQSLKFHILSGLHGRLLEEGD